MPLARLAHCFGHHEIGERRHQAVVIDRTQEMTRLQQAAARVLPADQRLQPGDLAGAQVDHRLVVEQQLVAGDAVTEVEKQGEMVGGQEIRI